MGFTCHKWDFVSTYNWVFRAITVVAIPSGKRLHVKSMENHVLAMENLRK